MTASRHRSSLAALSTGTSVDARFAGLLAVGQWAMPQNSYETMGPRMLCVLGCVIS
jgi:hypothetical protein